MARRPAGEALRRRNTALGRVAPGRTALVGTALVGIALVGACTTDPQDQRVTLHFSDQALADATTEVRWRIYRGGTAPETCQQLSAGQARAALVVQLDTRLSFPFGEDALLPGELADGTYTFFAEAFGEAGTQAFLNGCLTVQLRARDAQPLAIVLAPVNGCHGAACGDAGRRVDARTAGDTRSPRADAGPDAPRDSAVADGPDRDAAAPDALRHDATAPDARIDARTCEPEWCDGEDNDCDSVPDNGEVCPDPTVRNSESFSRSVYFVGTLSEGQCSKDALQAVWPQLKADYLTGFDCHASRYRFRRSDQALFYYSSANGIMRDGSSDSIVPTPPCGRTARPVFDFDGDGVLHYRCADTLRRGNGAVVASGIKRLVAVLPDGRSVVIRASLSAAAQDDYVALALDGSELARLAPSGQFSGTLEADPEAATIEGNQAYVSFRRSYAQQSKEIVVFRLTALSQWERVRRASVPDFGLARLVISDGTVFVRERDPLTSGQERIVAYLPDNTSRIVWREADATTVRAHSDWQLLAGPR